MDTEEIKDIAEEVTEAVEEKVEEVEAKAEEAVVTVSEAKEDTAAKADASADKKTDSPESYKGLIIGVAVFVIVAILGMVAFVVLRGGAKKIDEVGDYKNYSYEAFSAEVTSSDVSNYYSQMVVAYNTMGYTGTKVFEDRKNTELVKGDTISFDYSGSVDGVKFEGGTAQGATLELGSGHFIPGFEDQIIGHKVGESFDINVTFPDNYGNEDLAGADAVFAITVNDVIEEVPLTEDNAYSVFFGYETKDELFADLKEYLEKHPNKSEDDYIEAQKEDYLGVIMQSTKYGNITKDVDELYDNQIKGLENQGINAGMDLETLATTFGYTSLDVLKEEVRNNSENQVKMILVLEQIGKDEKIALEDSAFDNYAKSIIAKVEGKTAEEIDNDTLANYILQYENNYGKDSFRRYIRAMYILDQSFEKFAKAE